jgi:hypothetical protein
MFAIIRTRWQTRPLSPRAKRRSSAARFAPKEICRHRPCPKYGTFAYQLYHIWGSKPV